MIEGDSAVIDGATFSEKIWAVADASKELKLAATNGSPSQFLILQGKAIGEPVAQRGPFVMNTQQEIMQAFHDYQSTQFGGWPWPQDAMVFPQEKGRFALLNGVEMTPDNPEGKRVDGDDKEL